MVHVIASNMSDERRWSTIRQMIEAIIKMLNTIASMLPTAEEPASEPAPVRGGADSDIDTLDGKVIDFNGKFRGRTFREAFNDPKYRKWHINRTGSSGYEPKRKEFIDYCMRKAFAADYE